MDINPKKLHNAIHIGSKMMLCDSKTATLHNMKRICTPPINQNESYVVQQGYGG